MMAAAMMATVMTPEAMAAHQPRSQTNNRTINVSFFIIFTSFLVSPSKTKVDQELFI